MQRKILKKCMRTNNSNQENNQINQDKINNEEFFVLGYRPCSPVKVKLTFRGAVCSFETAADFQWDTQKVEVFIATAVRYSDPRSN